MTEAMIWLDNARNPFGHPRLLSGGGAVECSWSNEYESDGTILLYAAGDMRFTQIADAWDTSTALRLD
jgi:hypothetical protein